MYLGSLRGSAIRPVFVGNQKKRIYRQWQLCHDFRGPPFRFGSAWTKTATSHGARQGVPTWTTGRRHDGRGSMGEGDFGDREPM